MCYTALTPCYEGRYSGLKLVDSSQASYMGEDLHGELVAVSEKHGGFPSAADTRGRARDDDSSLGQGRAGGEEAHNLGHGEDQIALGGNISTVSPDGRRQWVGMCGERGRGKGGRTTRQVDKMQRQTYSNPLSCMTLPLSRPLILRFLTSPAVLALTSTGPIGHEPSKPLE